MLFRCWSVTLALVFSLIAPLCTSGGHEGLYKLLQKIQVGKCKKFRQIDVSSILTTNRGHQSRLRWYWAFPCPWSASQAWGSMCRLHCGCKSIGYIKTFKLMTLSKLTAKYLDYLHPYCSNRYLVDPHWQGRNPCIMLSFHSRKTWARPT